MNHDNPQKSNEYTHEEWEVMAQQLINAKFDLDKQLSWEQSLAKQGIVRKRTTLKRIPLRNRLAVAASFLFILAAGWYLVLHSSSPAQKLALQHIETPHQLVDEVKRGAEGVAQNKGRAMEAYYNQQYDVALRHLQVIEAEEQADADVYFQMGLCLMYKKTPDYHAAIKAFAEARRLDPDGYQDEINWYSALCLILTKQPELAKAALEKVADSPSSRKHAEAEKLLQTLSARK